MSNYNFIDLTGRRFGKLLVIKKSKQKAKSGSMYECKCDCGNIVTIARCSLVSGHTKSCGCSRKSFLSATKPSKTHGYSRINGEKCERLYRVWLGMRQRCNNPNNLRYKHYGGRGISVCDEWNNYADFRRWAYANVYDENAARNKCTIDRIDNDGNYEPSNCRWVDMSVQCKNKNKKRHNND